jgi:hypothetical protein
VALSRETAETLAAMGTDELFEYVRQNPNLAAAIANLDPRVKLMEEFYADPDAKADFQKHGKRLYPKASVPEIDIPEKINASLKPEREKIAALEKELRELRMGGKRKVFRESLVAEGADEADLDNIEQFMVDNEFGPKAAKQAVRAFYETKTVAEPNFKAVLTMPDGGGAEHIKALLGAGPGEDLDDINAPFVEKIVAEEFGGAGRRPTPTRPVMA